MKKNDAIYLLQAIAFVVLTIILVGALTTAHVFLHGEPGARWDLAMNHIMFGVVAGPIMIAILTVFHFINAYLKYRCRKRQH